MKIRFAVYAAGDMRSGWQDKLRALLPADIHILDPRAHGLTDPAAYTKWDLDAVKDSTVVVVYMGPHNPSGFGLSIEAGFAHALGRKIIFVDEMQTDWRGKYFDMLRQISTVVPSLEAAAKEIDGCAVSIERDSQGEKDEPQFHADPCRVCGKRVEHWKGHMTRTVGDAEDGTYHSWCYDKRPSVVTPPPEHGRLEPGQWVHCSPELINAGLNCANIPRRDCQCEGGGSHDHFIAFRCRAPLNSPPASATPQPVLSGEAGEIVERLRAPILFVRSNVRALANDAADLIERQAAEVAALQGVVKALQQPEQGNNIGGVLAWYRAIRRAALPSDAEKG